MVAQISHVLVRIFSHIYCFNFRHRDWNVFLLNTQSTAVFISLFTFKAYTNSCMRCFIKSMQIIQDVYQR